MTCKMSENQYNEECAERVRTSDMRIILCNCAKFRVILWLK